MPRDENREKIIYRDERNFVSQLAINLIRTKNICNGFPIEGEQGRFADFLIARENEVIRNGRKLGHVFPNAVSFSKKKQIKYARTKGSIPAVSNV